MADLGEVDRQVRTELYRFFLESGHPPVAAEVAASLDLSPGTVEQSYQRLHDAHVIVLAPGTPYVWMANPFSALPTPYRATAGARSYWGNCIWDALGIVAVLGERGSVTASCPDCGDELRIEVSGEEIRSEADLVHYAVPAARWWDDIGFN